MSSKTRNLLPVIVILLLGAGLRIIAVGQQSLWLDEFFSFFLARKDLSSIVEGTAQDVLPPLYYFLLHFALEVGQSEAAIRAVSVIFSILTLPILYVLAKSLFSRRVALVSTLLLAINPLHVLYSQEARMYTMFVFFSGLVLFFFWRAWRWNKRIDWLLFALSMTLVFYTHSLALFNLLAIDIFCLIRTPRLKERWQGLLVAHVLSILLFLPWVVVMINQLPRLQSEFIDASQSILTLITTPHIFLFGYSLPAVLSPFALFAGLALVAFSLLSVWYAFRNRKPEVTRLLLVLCVFVVPVLSAYLMSFITPIFVIRRLLPASLGLLLLVSWTVMEAKPRWLNIATGIGVALLMFVSLANYYVDPDVQKIPFREIVQQIEDEAKPDDIFIQATDTSALAFAYYAPHLQSHFLEGDPDYVTETNRGRAQRIAGLQPEEMEAMTNDSEYFWLVVVTDHNLDYQTQVVDSFDAEFGRVSHEAIHGVDVLQYSTTR